MAKRKHKFLRHGKCRACGGPITDWRTFHGLSHLRRFCEGKCRTLGDAEARLNGDLALADRIRKQSKAANFGLAYGMPMDKLKKMLPDVTAHYSEAEMARIVSRLKGRK